MKSIILISRLKKPLLLLLFSLNISLWKNLINKSVSYVLIFVGLGLYNLNIIINRAFSFILLFLNEIILF